jgi:hypothetical protein
VQLPAGRFSIKKSVFPAENPIWLLTRQLQAVSAFGDANAERVQADDHIYKLSGD